ncbi:uncharacterized protein [Anomalospiza imberbis]|uniref:uncharacterized protein n=1 Tax=Anomalospiza imberbis TaxID=187417 RepID=UPI00358F70D4
MNDTPPLAMIRCANWKDAWEVLDIWGTWHRLAENLICATAKCPKPLWDARLQFLENEAEFPQIRELTLTCPKGLEPSFPEVKCTKEIQGVRSGKPVYVDAWWGRNSTGAWTRIERDVLCMEMCQRPLWDSTLQLVPHKDNYEKDEEVKLSCPEGFQPPFTEIQCQTQLQYDGYGTPTPVSKEFWHGRDSRGAWVPIQSSLECTEVLQVDPETFEISSTSIKLKWTCRFPDACQGMRAMCRLAAPSSPPCEAEEVNGEQMLHGQEGTFTCSPLQPFTEYSVTIGLPSSTVIYRNSARVSLLHAGMCLGSELGPVGLWGRGWESPEQGMPHSHCPAPHHAVVLPTAAAHAAFAGDKPFVGSPFAACPLARSCCTLLWPQPLLMALSVTPLSVLAVPDKPEQLWLDPDRGSLRWSSLPSCNGEIIGYQLSITARNAGDSSVLETERLRLDGSVTEHRLPEHSPGSSYAVTIQGLTAAGAGAALMREFHGNSSSDTPRPQAISCRSVRDIAPAQGTAVLPLRPIARGSEAAREHQLIVAATHNGSLIESICSGQPRLSNASVYLAAVLNLTAPTDFVLGDGSRGQGEHNAALRPGRDYTALLRLVRLGPQAEKFTCVCYSFSVGKCLLDPGAQASLLLLPFPFPAAWQLPRR